MKFVADVWGHDSILFGHYLLPVSVQYVGLCEGGGEGLGVYQLDEVRI